MHSYCSVPTRNCVQMQKPWLSDLCRNRLMLCDCKKQEKTRRGREKNCSEKRLRHICSGKHLVSSSVSSKESNWSWRAAMIYCSVFLYIFCIFVVEFLVFLHFLYLAPCSVSSKERNWIWRAVMKYCVARARFYLNLM